MLKPDICSCSQRHWWKKREWKATPLVLWQVVRFVHKYEENGVNRHTRVWLEAWSTTDTDRDVLGSVSSKASSMFSWGKTGRLTEPLMLCEDANQFFLQEKSKSRYGKNKYARLLFLFKILFRSQGDWQGLSSLDSFGALGYYLSVECNNNLSFWQEFQNFINRNHMSLVKIKAATLCFFMIILCSLTALTIKPEYCTFFCSNYGGTRRFCS